MATAESAETPAVILDDILVEKRPKVCWPASNNTKAWKEFEAQVLKKIKKMKGTTAERMIQFEDAIYACGKESFGIKERKDQTPNKGGKSRKQRLMEHLRKEKKDLRKRWKTAAPCEKEGLTQLYEDLKKKCRNIQRSIRRTERSKEARRARTKFLKNPFGETKKLFVAQKSGTLECTKEELNEHVRSTYRDERRREALPAMPKLKPVTKPRVKFNLGSLTKNEVDGIVKKGRAGSNPGGEGVTYKVFNYCNQLRYQLLLLLKKLWKERQLVDRWTFAEGVYLPKEEESGPINQFHPISTLSVCCKIYMGILAKRTMAFLRQNEYINEEVQKAGIPSLPGCIEHAFSIWDQIQEVKEKKEDLSIIWLDLANAYGSVPHKVLFLAMEHFHIPEEIRVLMMQYYSNFKMRFTTTNFTTDWHALEVGIAAGCTISVIWFILVMEMILQASGFDKDHTKVRSPIKAFMDDITLLTREKNAMARVMDDLDELISWAKMKFNAKKSRSLSFRKGNQVQTRFSIGGEKIPTVKEKPVKRLGRLYAGSLTDRHQGVAIQRQAEDGLKIIDRTKLPGKYKIWCLQFGLYQRLTWPLTINDVALTIH